MKYPVFLTEKWIVSYTKPVCCSVLYLFLKFAQFFFNHPLYIHHGLQMKVFLPHGIYHRAIGVNPECYVYGNEGILELSMLDEIGVRQPDVIRV